MITTIQNESNQPGLLTVSDAAAFLSLARSTVYQLMDAGKLRYKKIGRARRIPHAELLAFSQSDLIGGWAQPAAMQPHSSCGGSKTSRENTGDLKPYSQDTATAEH
jgi:excisionase family DNA binding protein